MTLHFDSSPRNKNSNLEINFPLTIKRSKYSRISLKSIEVNIKHELCEVKHNSPSQTEILNDENCSLNDHNNRNGIQLLRKNFIDKGKKTSSQRLLFKRKYRRENSTDVDFTASSNFSTRDGGSKNGDSTLKYSEKRRVSLSRHESEKRSVVVPIELPRYPNKSKLNGCKMTDRSKIPVLKKNTSSKNSSRVSTPSEAKFDFTDHKQEKSKISKGFQKMKRPLSSTVTKNGKERNEYSNNNIFTKISPPVIQEKSTNVEPKYNSGKGILASYPSSEEEFPSLVDEKSIFRSETLNEMNRNLQDIQIHRASKSPSSDRVSVLSETSRIFNEATADILSLAFDAFLENHRDTVDEMESPDQNTQKSTTNGRKSAKNLREPTSKPIKSRDRVEVKNSSSSFDACNRIKDGEQFLKHNSIGLNRNINTVSESSRSNVMPIKVPVKALNTNSGIFSRSSTSVLCQQRSQTSVRPNNETYYNEKSHHSAFINKREKLSFCNSNQTSQLSFGKTDTSYDTSHLKLNKIVYERKTPKVHKKELREERSFDKNYELRRNKESISSSRSSIPVFQWNEFISNANPNTPSNNPIQNVDEGIKNISLCKPSRNRLIQDFDNELDQEVKQVIVDTEYKFNDCPKIKTLFTVQNWKEQTEETTPSTPLKPCEDCISEPNIFQKTLSSIALLSRRMMSKPDNDNLSEDVQQNVTSENATADTQFMMIQSKMTQEHLVTNSKNFQQRTLHVNCSNNSMPSMTPLRVEPFQNKFKVETYIKYRNIPNNIYFFVKSLYLRISDYVQNYFMLYRRYISFKAAFLHVSHLYNRYRYFKNHLTKTLPWYYRKIAIFTNYMCENLQIFLRHSIIVVKSVTVMLIFFLRVLILTVRFSCRLCTESVVLSWRIKHRRLYSSRLRIMLQLALRFYTKQKDPLEVQDRMEQIKLLLKTLRCKYNCRFLPKTMQKCNRTFSNGTVSVHSSTFSAKRDDSGWFKRRIIQNFCGSSSYSCHLFFSIVFALLYTRFAIL